MDSLHEYSFERLDAWKLSKQLVSTVYLLAKKFPKDEVFGLISQVKRAVVSIPTNLAEGSYRSSHRDRNHFYEISYGSLIEVLNLMIIAKDLGHISDDDLTEIRKNIEIVSLVITGLSKSTRDGP